MNTPPVLHIRAREARPGEKLPDMDQHQVVEVFDDDGALLGQLPFNKVDYEMVPHGLGHLTVRFLCKGAEIGVVP